MNLSDKKLKHVIFITVLLTNLLFSHPAISEDNRKTAEKKEELLTRIDFGNSYISGQTLKSGAVYLLQRKKSDIKTMLKYRENYRKEILESHDIRNRRSEKSDTN